MHINLKAFAVAVDGSPASMEAIAWVTRTTVPSCRILAVDIKDARIFYENHPQFVPVGAENNGAGEMIASWQADAELVRQAMVRRLEGSGRRPEWYVVSVTWAHPTAASAFYEFARLQHVDGLVCGRHRGSAAVEGLFGSFPHWLVLHSDLPVIIIPRASEPDLLQ